MAALERARAVLFAKLAVTASCAMVASATAAQQWPSLYADEATGLDVELGSVSLVPGYQGVVGAWFVYTHPGLSARCIPPPRACYAKAQRVYYHINCANLTMAQIQRITFGLNGDPTSQSEPDFGALYYMPPNDALEGGLARTLCSAVITRSSAPSITVEAPRETPTQ